MLYRTHILAHWHSALALQFPPIGPKSTAKMCAVNAQKSLEISPTVGMGTAIGGVEPPIFS